MIITHDKDTLFITLDNYGVATKSDYDSLIGNVKKETGAYDMDVIVIKRESITDVGTVFSYLYPKGNKVVGRYLFNPAIFKKFQKKGQCDNLWHGCEAPSIERIYEFSKTYKEQEKCVA